MKTKSTMSQETKDILQSLRENLRYEEIQLEIDELEKFIEFDIQDAEEHGYDNGLDYAEDDYNEAIDNWEGKVGEDVREFLTLMRPFLDDYFDATNPSHNEMASLWNGIRKEIVNE